MTIWFNKNIQFIRWINIFNWLNENNYFVEYTNHSLNQNSYFVEYINNYVVEYLHNYFVEYTNIYFVEYINNSLNQSNYFVKRLKKLFRWILQHLINRSIQTCFLVAGAHYHIKSKRHYDYQHRSKYLSIQIRGVFRIVSKI